MKKYFAKSSRSMINKAIVPIAGFGSRMQPITDYLAKEMLPIVTEPAICFIIEELYSVGISSIIFVTNRRKNVLNNYLRHLFSSRYPKLEYQFISQDEPLGLGHAVALTRPVISLNEAFLIALPDNLIFPIKNSLSRALVETYERTGCWVVGVTKIELSETTKRAIVKFGQQVERGCFQIKEIIDKPTASFNQKTYAIAGRYVVTDRLFDYLRDEKNGHCSRELTLALSVYGTENELLGLVHDSEKFDIGSPEGYYNAFRYAGAKIIE